MKIRNILLGLAGMATFLSSASTGYPEPYLSNESNKWGYAYLTDGVNLVINYEFDDAERFDMNVPRARVLWGGKYYLIDLNGKKVVGPYDEISPYADPDTGCYVVRSGEKRGVVNMDGEIKIPIKFSTLWPTNTGFYEGEASGVMLYINPRTGEETSSWEVFSKWSNQ